MKLVKKMAAAYYKVEEVMFQFIADLEKLGSPQELKLKPIKIEVERNRIHPPPRK